MNLPSQIRILSRKSDLAIIQARHVGERINQTFPDVKILTPIADTRGNEDVLSANISENTKLLFAYALSSLAS